jgi:hypothetical protein
VGKANLITDNVIAESSARPFIIVMDNGVWAMPGARHPAGPPAEAAPGQRPANWPPPRRADKFRRILLMRSFSGGNPDTHARRSSLHSMLSQP